MKLTTTLLLILCLTSLWAQDEILNEYIRTGLESNLALKQQQADYEKSLQALRAAKGLFFPNIGINARYTVAQGGRVIEFPVGDLLNPVYSSLNQIMQLPPEQQFPTVENEEFPFYRPTEQETKLSLMQPIIKPSVAHNYRIEKGKSEIQKADVEIYRRELILEIKTAYYNFLRAEYFLRLVDDTEELLKENLRVSESLHRNDKVTLDVVYRSEAELQKVYLSRSEAKKSWKTAQAYLNFLLNRPLETEIEIFEYEQIPHLELDTEIDSALSRGLQDREELAQLETYAEINNRYTKLMRSNNLPSVALAVDYGFQGEQYSFTSDDDFMLASVVLRWELFHGLKNNAEVQKAKIAQHQVQLKEEETRKQIQLQIIQSYYELEAAHEAIASARAQKEAAEKAFEVTEEKYRIGQSRLIEYTDARTTFTQSQQNLVIAVFEFKIREAEFERAIAENPLY